MTFDQVVPLKILGQNNNHQIKRKIIINAHDRMWEGEGAIHRRRGEK
jgi:hypothetical protein